MPKPMTNLDRHSASLDDTTARPWRMYAKGAFIGCAKPCTAQEMHEAVSKARRACTLEIEPATNYGFCFIY